jgi:putative thioredoxin
MADSPYVIELNAGNFQQVVLESSHQQPVLVDFWADWCAPCRSLMPLLAKLAEEYQGKFILAKLNTEEERDIAAQFGIRSLPTVKLFSNGEVADEFMGALPEAQIRAFLDKNIPRESDSLLQLADSLLLQGETEEAGELIEKANLTDPDHPRVKLSYARYLATVGELAEAESLLNTLPLDEREKPDVIGLMSRISFGRIASDAPSTQELKGSLESDPANSLARYQLAARMVMDNDFESALEHLLTLMIKDRQFNDDAGRKGMLLIFDLIGSDSDLVKRYRSRMFNALH